MAAILMRKHLQSGDLLMVSECACYFTPGHCSGADEFILIDSKCWLHDYRRLSAGFMIFLNKLEVQVRKIFLASRHYSIFNILNDLTKPITNILAIFIFTVKVLKV